MATEILFPPIDLTLSSKGGFSCRGFTCSDDSQEVLIPTGSQGELSASGKRRVVWDAADQSLVDKRALRCFKHSKSTRDQNRQALVSYYLSGLQELRTQLGCGPGESLRPARVFHYLLAGTGLEPHLQYDMGVDLTCGQLAQVAKEFKKLSDAKLIQELSAVISAISEEQWDSLPEGTQPLNTQEMEALSAKFNQVPEYLHAPLPESARLTAKEKTAILSAALLLSADTKQGTFKA
jgi:hypothetical protein